jgi:hypothetical protein
LTRLLFVTQQVDPAHPALAATVPKVRALARRVDEVVVLADAAVPEALPANCRARSFRASTRAGRGLRFEAALAAELRGLRGGAVVAHMCPIYAVLAAPLARPLRIPVVLWYTHWRASRLLRLAERASSAVVSVDRRSFPLGRYSSAKGLDVVLRALREVDGASLLVHGPALTPEEREHRAHLEVLVRELGLDGRVRLEGPVPRAEVPRLLGESHALVNNMRAGAPDKVVYEAAASCVPVLASNPVFDELLEPELRFAREDGGELAERLRRFAALALSERTSLGRKLRKRVEARHSVESWADGVLAAAGLR